MPTRPGRLCASPFRVFIPKGDSPAIDARAHCRHGHDPAFTRRLDQQRAAALHRLAPAKLGSRSHQACLPSDRRLARHDPGRLVPRQHHEPLLAGRPRQPQRCRHQADTAGVTCHDGPVLPDHCGEPGGDAGQQAGPRPARVALGRERLGPSACGAGAAGGPRPGRRVYADVDVFVLGSGSQTQRTDAGIVLERFAANLRSQHAAPTRGGPPSQKRVSHRALPLGSSLLPWSMRWLSRINSCPGRNLRLAR